MNYQARLSYLICYSFSLIDGHADEEDLRWGSVCVDELRRREELLRTVWEGEFPRYWVGVGVGVGTCVHTCLPCKTGKRNP